MPNYTQAIPRNTWDKHGERVSLLDYMSAGLDAAGAFNAAIQKAAGERGGCSIQIPVGTFIITTPILVNVPNIVIYGEGENSIIQRGADMPDNQAMFMVSASNVLFRDFLVDGDVTTSVGYNILLPPFYPNMDPLYVDLTKNSSFWVKGVTSEVEKVRFERVTFTHTGGYSIIFDATHQYLVHMRVSDCRFINNRPHTFGYTAGDLGYGAWTGGILVEGDGQNNAAHDVLISGNSFMRCNGNGFWTHLYAFNRMHSNIRVKQNDFLDIGRDGVLMGGINGGVVEGNTMRRIGYIHTTDVDIASPKWLSGQWAVGIDTSGLTIGVNYVNNVMTSCNGGYFDCDGFSQATIVGNKCRTPGPGDPDYIVDQIAAPNWGGRQAAGQSDWAYGINFGNTSHLLTGDQGARGATIVGNNFQNMGKYAIGMYATRDCLVADNDIYTLPSPAAQPIVIGNLNYTDMPNSQITRGYNNVVTHNRFHWKPGFFEPCIFEDTAAGGNGQPYQAGEGNVVRSNDIISESFMAYEFERDPTSTSNTAHHYSSNYTASGKPLTYTSSHILQREGRDVESTSVLRIYNVDANPGPGAVTSELHAQLQAYSRLGNRSPLFNVSKAGTALTGVVTTGDRTQAGFDDCMLTGKLYGDAFFCLAEHNYADADANLLTDKVGLIRYKLGTPNKFQQSVAVDTTGKRIWIDLGGGGGSIGTGSDKQIYYNAAGNATTDANFQWDYSAQIMTVVGKPGQVGIQSRNDTYMAADSGFVALKPGYSAFNGAATGAGAFVAGVAISPYTPPAGPPTPPPPNGGYIDFAPLGYANYPVPLLNATFASQQVLLWNSGQNGTAAGAVNSATGLMTNAFINASAGFQTLSLLWNSIQAPSGGVYAKSLHADRYIHTGEFTRDLDPAQGDLTSGDGLDAGTLFWNSTLNELRVYNGNNWVSLDTGTSSASPGGVDGSVQFKLGSAFAGDANFKWNNTTQIATILGKAGQQGLIVTTGYTQSNGFTSTLNSWEAVNGADGGGGAYMSGYGLAPTPITGGFTGGYIDIAPLTNQSFPLPLTGLSAFGASDVLLWVSTANGTITAPTGNYGLMTNSFISAFTGFLTPNVRYNSMTTAGGVNARSVAVTQYVQVGHSASDLIAGPILTPGDTYQAGAMYWNDTALSMMVHNGTAWIKLGAIGGVGGAFGSVQYNLNGAFAGDGNLTWNSTVQSFAVKGKTAGQAAVTVTVGYTQSDGFSSTLRHWQAFNGATNGGGATMGAYALTPYQDNVIAKWTGGYINIAPLGASYGGNYPNPMDPLSAFGATTALLWVSGGNGTTTPVTGLALNVNMAVNSAVGFVTAYAAYNAIQATGGGVYGLSMHALRFIDPGQSNGAPPLTPGMSAFRAGSLYWDTTAAAYRIFNGTSWVALSFAIGGVDLSVQYNKGGVLAGDNQLYWDYTNWQLQIVGKSNTVVSLGVTGVIQTTGGLNSTSAVWNTIQAASGGITGRSVVASAYMQLGHNAGVPAVTGTDSFHQGAIYWDDTIAALQVFNGTVWVTPGGATGVGGLTPTRIPYASNATTLADTPNMFWEGSTNSIGVTALGVNGLSAASQVRISIGRVDNGGYLTVTSDRDMHVCAGVSYNPSLGGWIQKSTTGSGSILATVADHLAWYQSDGNPTSGAGAYTVTERMMMTNAGIKFRFTADNALQVLNSGETTWGGAVFGVLAVQSNYGYTRSQVRISQGAVNAGMFLTSTTPNQADVSGGMRWDGSNIGWIATDPICHLIEQSGGGMRFFISTGNTVGAGASLVSRMVIDGSGNVSAQSNFYAQNFVNTVNAGGYYLTYTNNTQHLVLSIDGVNSMYLDNRSGAHIYILPQNGQFTFFGASWACPNGDLATNLGHPSYRWATAYIANLAITGTVTGAVRSIAQAGLPALFGDVTFTAGTNITLSQSGTGLTINAIGGGSINGTDISPSQVHLPNNGRVWWQNTAGSIVAYITLYTDNNMYIDNDTGNTTRDIFIRPSYGRFIFLGNGGYACSNGDNAVNLGHPSYRWSNVYVYNSIVCGTGGYTVINSAGQFVGAGVNCPGYGVACTAVNIVFNGGQAFGNTLNGGNYITLQTPQGNFVVRVLGGVISN